MVVGVLDEVAVVSVVDGLAASWFRPLRNIIEIDFLRPRAWELDGIGMALESWLAKARLLW